jgi:hypothetical protein
MKAHLRIKRARGSCIGARRAPASTWFVCGGADSRPRDAFGLKMRARYLPGLRRRPGRHLIAFVSIVMPTLVRSFDCVAVILAEQRVLHYMPALTRATFQ